MSPDTDQAHSSLSRWRCAAVRTFFLLFATVLFIDTSPNNWSWTRAAKQFVCPALNYCGLWQGQWTLFAPNPIVNNAWLSAEIYRPDGTQQEVWNSTYWATSTGWERFVGFRRINHRNRMAAIDSRATDDFADYLARQLISPTAHCVNTRASDPAAATLGEFSYATVKATEATPPWRLVLSRNQLDIVLPDDGRLPKRDETLRVSSSKNLAVREYQP